MPDIDSQIDELETAKKEYEELIQWFQDHVGASGREREIERAKGKIADIEAQIESLNEQRMK